MAEAAVDSGRNPLRFFCHRCNIEFEDVIQSETCPYCDTGFIERLEHSEGRDSLVHSLDDDYSDAEMSNIDDAGNTDDSILDESLEGSNSTVNEVPPMLNDLAFLMSGRARSAAGLRQPRQDSLMEQLVWMIGGGRVGTGAVTAGVAGAPFVLVGSPGDYVFGGEGLDAVVTQLLGQLENSGPPPLPTEQIAAIPNEKVTAAQVEASMSCSVCWDNFTLDETVSRLECEHIFHPACIAPWLQLHATCPICRRSLLPAQSPAPSDPAAPRSSDSMEDTLSQPSISRVVVRRYPHRVRRRPAATPATDTSSTGSGSGSGSGSAAGSVGSLWAQLTSSISSIANPDASTTSLNSSERDRYMDIDFD